MIFIWDTTRPEGLTSVSSDDTIGVALTAGTATVLFDEDIVLLDASRVLFVNDLDESSYKGAVAVLGGNGNSPTLNIDYTGLSFGTKYRIQVKPGAISDVATNSLLSNFTARFTTIIDTIAPVVNSLSAGSITTTGATLLVTTDESATCRYATTDSEYATMTAFDAPNTGTSHTAVLTGLTPSTGYDFYVRCADTTAQTNTMTTSAHVSFTTSTPTPDTTAPIINSISLDMPAYRVTQDTDVTATVVEDDTADTVMINGNTATEGMSGTWTATFAHAQTAPGTFSFNVVAVDSLGNTNTQMVFYDIVSDDAIVPVVVITSPVPGTTVFGMTSFTFTTDGGATAAAAISIDGGSYVAATTNSNPGTYDFDSTTLTDGSHTVRVRDTVSGMAGYSNYVPFLVNNAPADTTPPVIILLGVNPQTLTVGDAYTELGAAASDDVDGDITSNLVIDASAINMAVAGTYTVTYNVSDAEGNDATEETRTVIVNAAFDDTAILAVTGIDAVNTFATADNTFANGWSWKFKVTVPTAETSLQMKFSDWTSSLPNTILVADNVRYSSAQASNGPILITAVNTLGGALTLTGDLESTVPGRQVEILIEAKIPVGSAGGSYSTSYGIETN